MSMTLDDNDAIKRANSEIKPGKLYIEYGQPKLFKQHFEPDITYIGRAYRRRTLKPVDLYIQHSNDSYRNQVGFFARFGDEPSEYASGDIFITIIHLSEHGPEDEKNRKL